VGEGVLISVVDDNESLRKAVKRLIECVGLCVEDFASAEDFLNSGRPQDSACLILDLGLPGMSGLELQTQLVATNCRVPIILMSAHGDGQARARALEAGTVDFLVKPFTEDALLKAVSSSLVLHRGGASEGPYQNHTIWREQNASIVKLVR
jgi:two-component system, LuxR family, response regulator FixJ